MRNRANALRIAVVALAAVVGPSAGRVQADLVYDTTGSFTPGSSATAITDGVSYSQTNDNILSTLDITFTGVTGQDLGLSHLGTSALGTFTVDFSAGSGPVTAADGTTFTLTINQESPPGMASFGPATISAMVSINSGQVDVTFTGKSVTINGTGDNPSFQYDLDNLTITDVSNDVFVLTAPETGNLQPNTPLHGDISVMQGIQSIDMPEPGVLVLTVSGSSFLVGCYVLSRRRRLRAA